MFKVQFDQHLIGLSDLEFGKPFSGYVFCLQLLACCVKQQFKYFEEIGLPVVVFTEQQSQSLAELDGSFAVVIAIVSDFQLYQFHCDRFCSKICLTVL